MDTLVANFTAGTRRTRSNGRDYVVAPAVLIVPGVLKGSRGSLFYPVDEIARNVERWNDIPITVGHPTRNGYPIDFAASTTPSIGSVRNARANGKLIAEAWIDTEKANAVDVRIVESLQAGRRLELSTGLFTDNEDAPSGAAYSAIARNYRPNHLAILLDQKGACSIADGCGVLVNENTKENEMNANCDCRTCDKRHCEHRRIVSNAAEENFAPFGPNGDSYLKKDGSLKQPPADTPQPVEDPRFVKFGLPSDPEYRKFLETT